MPSLRETTGSVVLEALENGLPVATMNKYGASIILNDDCGILYEVENNTEPAETIAKVIMECVDNPGKVEAMKPFCKKGQKNCRLRIKCKYMKISIKNLWRRIKM